MERLEQLWKKEISLNLLERQKRNFFFIGVDTKNPLQLQSNRLRPFDVLNLTNAGIKILATPHIGLHWPSNSMYPHMGVRICDYTGNQSFVDYADEPQNIKERGITHNCALQTEQVLSPYLRVSSLVISSNGYVAAKNFAHKTNLAHVHHKAKQLVLGEQNVMLDSDLLLVPFVFDFFQILIENEQYILQGYDSRLGIFDRHVTFDGAIERTQPGLVSDINAFLEMKSKHAQMIREDCILPATGFFPIKEAMLLLDSLVCYWEQKQSGLLQEPIGDTYTVSGVDMINYTKNEHLRDVIDRMYKVILKSSKFDWLPEYMLHTILPGGVFRFLPSTGEPYLLEKVTELLLLKQEGDARSRTIATLQDETKWSLIGETAKWKSECFLPAKEHFLEVVSQRRGFTQYDLLNGEYVPQEITNHLMNMTFEEIGVLFKY